MALYRMTAIVLFFSLFCTACIADTKKISILLPVRKPGCVKKKRCCLDRKLSIIL